MVTVAVPNPSASASVDAVTVDLPDGILGATTQALPGWTATVTRATTAQGASVPQVERITWTAESAVLAPGELQQFTVLIGPLPSTGRIARLPVTVGLSDGTARTWGPSTPVLRLTRAARGNASAHG